MEIFELSEVAKGQTIPTAKSELHCLLMAIVMGREQSKAFMWAAMSLQGMFHFSSCINIRRKYILLDKI
jgi:hypothetical protein